MCERVPPGLEDQFPNLHPSGYHKTSEPDTKYNCVAWAAEHDKTRWWEPAEPLEPGMHWPAGVPKGYYPENFVGLFDNLGFSICNSAELEDGFEKIVIYEDFDGWFTHVARQLQDGRWESKLGATDDIEHNSINAFDGSLYGRVSKIMRRKRLSV